MNSINRVDFGSLVRECAGTVVFIAEVTSEPTADTKTDWKTSMRHAVDVIIAHIDKVIAPQWVQVAVEHLDGEELTVPAEVAATSPLTRNTTLGRLRQYDGLRQSRRV